MDYTTPCWREESDFKSRDGRLLLKARITKEGSLSSRVLASDIKTSFREPRSFRKPATISSTASSPGYSFRDQIDPSSYSFTAALKALQVRSGSGWEYGKALNSKWYEAEKYICNPLSGEVPMECLSAKTLSGRSLATSKSAPLFLSNSLMQTRLSETPEELHFTRKGKVGVMGSHGLWTRDVGTQSTPPDLSPTSSIPISPPPIQETSETFAVEVLNGFHVESKSKDQEVRWKHMQEGQARKKKSGLAEKGKCKFVTCLAAWSAGLRRKQKQQQQQVKNI